MIGLHFDGSAAVVTIDRPEKRNALTLELMTELVARVNEAGDSGRAAIVLTGNGAFCSGADLGEVMARRNLRDDRRRDDIRSVTQSLTRALIDAPIPTLAAVDGPAIGLGMDLALACDQLLVGPEGWLMQGWGRIGVVPATGGILLLRRRNDWLLWKLLADQARLHALEVERLGLGEQAVPGPARAVAVNRANQLGAIPPAALRAYVALSRKELRQALSEHLEQCAEVQPGLLSADGLDESVQKLLRLPPPP